MKSSKVDVKYQKWTLIIQNYKKEQSITTEYLGSYPFLFS